MSNIRKEQFETSMRAIDPNAYKLALSLNKTKHRYPFGPGSSLPELYKKAKHGNLTPHDAFGVESSRGGRVRKSRRKKTKTRRKKSKSRRRKKSKTRRRKNNKSRRH